MTNATRGFDDDEVEPQWQVRQTRSVGENAAFEQAVRRGSHSRPLPMVDGLLGQAELATRPPADLDGDQRAWWTRIDGHQVELVSTNVEIASQDRPTCVDQAARDEILRAVSGSLGSGSHPSTLRGRPCLALTP